jgi:hypothetical protein
MSVRVSRLNAPDLHLKNGGVGCKRIQMNDIGSFSALQNKA